MPEVTIAKNPINIEALDADLRAALGAGVRGVSFASGLVTVHLTSQAPANASGIATTIVLSHNPNNLTPQQQAAIQQIAKLNMLRQANMSDLNTAPFIDPLLSILAQKLAWIEQEIIAIRAGR